MQSESVVKGMGEFNTDNSCETPCPKAKADPPPFLRKWDREKERGFWGKRFCYFQKAFMTFSKSELL